MEITREQCLQVCCLQSSLRASETIHNVLHHIQLPTTRAKTTKHVLLYSTRTRWLNQNLMVCQNPSYQTLLSGVIGYVTLPITKLATCLSEMQTYGKGVKLKGITLMRWRRVVLQPASTYKLAGESDQARGHFCSVQKCHVHLVQTYMLEGDARTGQAWSKYMQECRTYTVTALCCNKCSTVFGHILSLHDSVYHLRSPKPQKDPSV